MWFHAILTAEQIAHSYHSLSGSCVFSRTRETCTCDLSSTFPPNSAVSTLEGFVSNRNQQYEDPTEE